MPLYEFLCHECGTIHEELRPVSKREQAAFCNQGHRCGVIYSVPALSIWDPGRPFPNAVKKGDGKFPTRSAYEAHLKMNGLAETKTDGKIKRPHGNKVIARY